MSFERQVVLTQNNLSSADEALAWIVQLLDTEFANATSVKIGIDQFMACDHVVSDGDDNGDELPMRVVWTAGISGVTESLDEDDDDS